MPRLRAWLILWAIALAGCETTTRIPSQPVAPFDNPVSVNALTPPIEEREPVPNDVWTVLRDGFALNHQTHEPTVAHAVDLYLARAPTLDIEVRAKRYLAYVVDEVRRRQLPMELALVPIIESTLNPYAHSRSGAAGLWQLIPPTAKHFGVHDGLVVRRSSRPCGLDDGARSITSRICMKSSATGFWRLRRTTAVRAGFGVRYPTRPTRISSISICRLRQSVTYRDCWHWRI